MLACKPLFNALFSALFSAGFKPLYPSNSTES
jgi:hypothetical protein